MLERWALQNAKWKKRIAALLYEHTHLRDAACLRALCEAEAQSIRTFGMRNPVCIIPNGVDLPDLVESSALEVESLPFQKFEGRKVLLYLGRLHPKKNVANLVRGWRQMLESHPSAAKNWILAIAGWGRSAYEQQLQELEAGPSVVFVGAQFGVEKNACYRASDAFILPSLSEGLPMAVLEAWAHAKPVLMTPECNLPEGFTGGAALQIGITPEQIAAGLKQLLEMTDDDRRAMGARGRTLVATKFSWPQIGQQMRSVYDWVLGSGVLPESVRL
jgi:poly(glycerol-phosphate) alpha-glucosyltransferase